MAAAAGIKLLWEDFEDLSKIIPLLAKVYPNGSADINQFHAAGGMSFIIGELLDEGLLHGSAKTVWGKICLIMFQKQKGHYMKILHLKI